jgi:hypothetical protein
MVAVCIIGYFRPQSRAIYVPVLIAGLVSFGVCLYYLAWAFQPDSGTTRIGALVRSMAVFGIWIGWAFATFIHLRQRRG